MNSKKIACIQCPKYMACSMPTKLFVNFCGANESVILHLRERAVEECRAHRGYYYCSTNTTYTKAGVAKSFNTVVVH